MNSVKIVGIAAAVVLAAGVIALVRNARADATEEFVLVWAQHVFIP